MPKFGNIRYMRTWGSFSFHLLILVSFATFATFALLR
jgi:hypothetical protein